jgi:putative hydrolase of the HAD superfamily
MFDAVVTFDDTKMRKPNREPFVEVLKRLGVRAEESLMIGDWAERDVVGAAQVGMKTIFARYGDTFGTVVSHADYEVDDITQVIDIVTQLNSGS